MALKRPFTQHATGYFEPLPSGDDLDLNSSKISNLADPTAAQDAATKAYVDAVATGLDWKASVRVLLGDTSAYTPSGTGVGATLTSPDDNVSHNTHDGVLLSVGDRCLGAQTGGDLVTPDADNGIYEVTTLANGAGQGLVLTRVTDADQDAEVTAGLAVFVTEGTTYADTAWVLVTNDPITVDTTALQFAQFSSATSKSYGAGLVDAANVINVELDTDADAQSAGADGGSSGLEFDVTGQSGQLRVRIGATGGLRRASDGVAVLPANDTVSTSASGLQVDSAPVSKSNLQAAEALTVRDPVAPSTTAQQMQQARANDDVRAKVVGVTLDAAASAADPIRVVRSGIVSGYSGLTIGAIYFLGITGGISTSLPTGNNRVIQVGQAISATELLVHIIDYGKKPA